MASCRRKADRSRGGPLLLLARRVERPLRRGRLGRILVSIRLDAERRLQLVVEDDGIGLPDCRFGDGRKGLGSKLVGRLAGQFGGMPNADRGELGGTRVVVTLPDLKVQHAW